VLARFGAIPCSIEGSVSGNISGVATLYRMAGLLPLGIIHLLMLAYISLNRNKTLDLPRRLEALDRAHSELRRELRQALAGANCGGAGSANPV
jgi:hypothetical protein